MERGEQTDLDARFLDGRVLGGRLGRRDIVLPGGFVLGVPGVPDAKEAGDDGDYGQDDLRGLESAMRNDQTGQLFGCFLTAHHPIWTARALTVSFGCTGPVGPSAPPTAPGRRPSAELPPCLG